jgi:hypothetical protein
MSVENCPECNSRGWSDNLQGIQRRCTACNGTGQVHEDPFEVTTKPDHPAPSRSLLTGVLLYSDSMQPDFWSKRTLTSTIEAIAVDEYDIDGTPHIIYYHHTGFYAQQKERT